jgi:hypothetical protein
MKPISSSPSTLKIGQLPVGGNQALELTLTGVEPFKVLKVNGGDDIIQVVHTTEGAKHEHKLQVTVQPNKEGELTRELEVLTDNKDVPKVIVPLTGTVKK